jgi:predicted kinase
MLMMEDEKNVLIMAGIPGSGKSYWVEHNVEPPYVYINADSIRKELYGDENEQGNPKEVFGKVFDRFQKALLDKNVSTIVVDNTSVAYKTRKDYYKLIDDLNIDCKIKLIVFTNFELAKQRNKQRTRVVPDFVMDRMISNFQLPIKEELSRSDFSWVEIKE